MSYPQVYYVTYREYLIRRKAYIDEISLQQGMLRKVLFHMIVGNPYIKKEHKPRKEADLYLLPNEANIKKNIQPTRMTRQEADFFRSSGYNVYEGHIK